MIDGDWRPVHLREQVKRRNGAMPHMKEYNRCVSVWGTEFVLIWGGGLWVNSQTHISTVQHLSHGGPSAAMLEICAEGPCSDLEGTPSTCPSAETLVLVHLPSSPFLFLRGKWTIRQRLCWAAQQHILTKLRSHLCIFLTILIKTGKLGRGGDTGEIFRRGRVFSCWLTTGCSLSRWLKLKSILISDAGSWAVE